MSVFVEYSYLKSLGVKENTILSGCQRFKNGISHFWHSIKDDIDQRRILIDIDTIPDSTRLKYSIPTGAEYQKMLDEQQISRSLEQEKERIAHNNWETLKKENNQVKRLVHAYEVEYQQYLPYYIDRFSYNDRLPAHLPYQYAKEHAFWLEMIRMSGNLYKPHFGEIPKFFEIFMECKQNMEFCDSITSTRQFRNKLAILRDALRQRQSIVDFIVPAFYKQKTVKKTNDFHTFLALSIYGHPNKYSYQVTADMINYHCENEGMKTISESWVKTLFRTENRLKTLVSSTRNGEKSLNDNILPHAVRNVTTFPGNIWMIDGTPVQFYCLNKEGSRSVRLNLFAVIDVSSRKIVGFDISYTEDKLNIIKALKMAVMNTGHLPKEIVSDNFSGKKSAEIMDLKEQMERLGTVWRHSRVKNPSDKSYIERFFGVFQSVEQALYDDYIGEGITSRNPNARRDPEYLAEVAKKKGLPTYTEMVQRIATMVARYNKREKGSRPSPNSAYESFPKPNAVPMDAVRTALFFWKKTTVKARRGMIKIKVRQLEHTYEIYDHDLKMKYQDLQVTVRYDENDLDTIMLFDKHDQVICECRKSIHVYTGIADRPEDDQNTLKVVAKKKSYQKHIDGVRTDIVDRGLKMIGKESMDIVHPLALEKNQVNDRESQQLLELYRDMNGITSDQEYKEDFKTLVTVNQKDNNADVREKLLEKKPSEKGFLRVIPNQ